MVDCKIIQMSNEVVINLWTGCVGGMVLVTKEDCQAGRADPCSSTCSELSLTNNCTSTCVEGRAQNVCEIVACFS